MERGELLQDIHGYFSQNTTIAVASSLSYRSQLARECNVHVHVHVTTQEAREGFFSQIN